MEEDKKHGVIASSWRFAPVSAHLDLRPCPLTASDGVTYVTVKGSGSPTQRSSDPSRCVLAH